MHDEKKTLVAVLASHDSAERNNSLARLFDRLCDTAANQRRLDNFRFIFTGGTFDRVLAGIRDADDGKVKSVGKRAKQFLLPRTLKLPDRRDGGVTVLSYLIVRRHCSIIWPFFTPITSHWLNPENLALMRLCDIWHVKRLMNSGSVEEWFLQEADKDAKRNLQEWPPTFVLGGRGRSAPTRQIPLTQRDLDGGPEIKKPDPAVPPDLPAKMTVALIAHDEMKSRMVEFAVDYEPELYSFGRILATGTTGREVGEAAASLHDNIYRYHSGPKGGDIEIATEILFGGCDVVVFFVDPLHPHPHIEDIRVVFGACMIQDKVRMLTNEMQVREWMDRVIKGRTSTGSV